MNIKNKYKIFSEISGGDLLPIEFFDLPFAPKRVFTVTNVPKNEIRGQHAHYETEQIFICTNGSILVGLDDGKTKEEVILLKGDGVLIKKTKAKIISFYELLGAFIIVSIYLLISSKGDIAQFSVPLEDLKWLIILGTLCTAFAFSVCLYRRFINVER